MGRPQQSIHRQQPAHRSQPAAHRPQQGAHRPQQSTPRAQQTPRPQLAPSAPPRVDVQPPSVDQTEKDARLVELLGLATAHDIGDVDHEAAIRLLESVEWNVMGALTRLRQDESDRTSTGDQGFPRSVVRTSRPSRLIQPLQPLRRTERLRSPLHFFQAPILSGRSEIGTVGSLYNAVDVDDDDGDGGDDEWTLDIQDWMNELLVAQGEADLEDAIRLSTEEAYSGGFSVPPVDEDALAGVTKLSVYVSADEKPQTQCTVCLEDIELGDSLRTLQCNHIFHMVCVDQWLAQSGQCPVCKCRVGR